MEKNHDKTYSLIPTLSRCPTRQVQWRYGDPVWCSIQVHLDAALRPEVVVEGESGGVQAAVPDQPRSVVVGRLQGRFKEGADGGFAIVDQLLKKVY